MKAIRINSTYNHLIFLTSSYEVEGSVEDTVDEIIKLQPVLGISKVGKVVTKQYTQIEGEKGEFLFNCDIRTVSPNKALIILILYPYWFYVVVSILIFTVGIYAVTNHFLNHGVQGSDHFWIGSILIFLPTIITLLIVRGMKTWRREFEKAIHVAQQ